VRDRPGGQLSWALVLFIPVVITSARKIGKEVRTRTRTGQDKLAEIQNILHETVTGNRIVKAFNTEMWEILRFKTAARRLFRANLRNVRIQSISSPLMDSIGAVAIAMFLFIGRNEILHGQMTMGLFARSSFCFSSSTIRCASCVFLQQLSAGDGASSSIFGYFDTEDDVKERPHAITLKRFQRAIQFQDVGFSYSTEEGEHQFCTTSILRCGPARCWPGGAERGREVYAGEFDSAFFDVSTGAIKIDGNDLRSLTLASLRRQVAQVTQETILFNDTVRNNIAYAGRMCGVGGGGGGAQCTGPRFYSAHAARLRYGDWREGISAVGRRAPAAGHRAGHPEGRADSDSG